MTVNGNRTSSSGERAEFAVTRWTVVLAAAGDRSGTQRRHALEELARSYWFPLCLAWVFKSPLLKDNFLPVFFKNFAPKQQTQQ